MADEYEMAKRMIEMDPYAPEVKAEDLEACFRLLTPASEIRGVHESEVRATLPWFKGPGWYDGAPADPRTVLITHDQVYNTYTLRIWELERGPAERIKMAMAYVAGTRVHP